MSEGTDRLLFRGSCLGNFGEYEVLVEEEPPEIQKKQRAVEDELKIVQQAVKKFNLEDENTPEEYESSQHKQWLRFQVAW